MTVQELRNLLAVAGDSAWRVSSSPDLRGVIFADGWITADCGWRNPDEEKVLALIVAAVNALPALLDVVMAAEDLLLDDDNWRQLPDLRAALDRLGET